MFKGARAFGGAYQAGRFFEKSGIDPKNAANVNALRLQKQLNIEQASSIFTENGWLKHEVISKAELIVVGDELKNPKLIGELARRWQPC